MDVNVVTETVIACPLPRVAAYAADPDNVSAWYVNIESVEWQSPRPAVVGSQIAFVARFLGRRLAYTYELVAERRLVMRTAEGPFPMETTYTWEAVGQSSTRMRLRNRGRPAGLSVLMVPFMSMMIRRANRKDLALLKEILERDAKL